MRTLPSFFTTALVSFLASCGGTQLAADAGADAGGSPSAPIGLNDASAKPDASPKSCGSSMDCTAKQYCERHGACGTDGLRGACLPRPESCTDLYSPTCGCDHRIHGNPCDATSMGVDVSSAGDCPSPQGWIACGDKYCEVHASYCQISGNDAPRPGEPTVTYACKALPPSCTGKSDCTCFPMSTPCLGANQCKATKNGADVGFQILCPGG